MTPNTYDRMNFGDIVGRAPNLFHQTSIKSIRNILRARSIIAPGTLWGTNPNVANSHYQGNKTRSDNLKLRADRGFIDYVFCSFSNGLQSGFHRYGYVAIEIDRSILLNKEAFIYPFNFVTSWNFARPADKYSDLSTWERAISNPRSINISEILVRRQIKLDENAIRFHCYSSHSGILMDLLGREGYDLPIIVHDNPEAIKGTSMASLERSVQIGNTTYRGMLSDDSKFITLFESSEDDDIEILGRFELDDEGNLIEFFPMSDRKQIIGKLVDTSEKAAERLATAR